MSKDKLGARTCLKLKGLEETRDFYKLELKKEDLTEIKRDKYLRALKLIEGFIEGFIFIEKEKKPGKEKSKNPFLNPDGSFDLIEEFPNYRKKKDKNKRVIGYDH